MKIQRKKLEIGGVPAFDRPRFTDSLHFPDDVTQLTAHNLSELMGKYAALAAFVEQEATTWSMAVIRIEQELEEGESQFMLKHPKTVFLERWRLENKLRQDLALRAIHRRLTGARTLRERAQSLVRIYERLINVLSRELSRRMATNDGSRYASLGK